MNILRYIITRNLKNQLKLLGLVFASAMLGLVPIQLLRMILDRAIPEKSLSLLLEIGVALLVTTLIATVVNFYRAVASEKAMTLFVSDLRAELIHHLLRVSQAFHIRTSIGQLTNRLTQDISRLGISVIWIFIEPLVQAVTFLVYFVYLLTVDIKLTLIAIAPLFLIVPLIPRINAQLSATAKKLTTQVGSYSGILNEVFSSISEIQNHATYHYEERRLSAKQQLVSSYQVDEQKHKAKLTLLSDTMRGVGPLAIYIYGAVLAIAGDLSAGALVAFAGALGGLYAALDRLLKYPPLLRFAQERFNELRELLKTPLVFPTSTSSEKEEGQVEGVGVSLSGVSFGYSPQNLTTKELSIDIKAGQHVALVGRSGCGKSTILSLIGGQLQQSAGEVKLDGARLDTISVPRRAGIVGFASQSPTMFNTNLRNNLAYALLRGAHGDPQRPLSFLESVAAAGLDPKLIEACKDVGFEEDLFDLGLKTCVAAEHSASMIGLRKETEAALAGRVKIEHFEPATYLSSATVAENLVFAPLAAPLSREEAQPWIRAAAQSQADLPVLLAEISWGIITQDLEFLARVSERNPTLLEQMGLTVDEVKERLSLSSRVGDRPRTEADLGAELFEELVYRGLSAREIEAEAQASLIAARSAFSRALAAAAPPQYDPARWHNSLSVRENLLFGIVDPSDSSANQKVHATLREVLVRAGFLERVLAWGLDFEVGERGARLSGGQRQKIAVARVLLKSPRLLLLDEINSSLDEVSAQRLQKLISDKYRERTVVAVTHRLHNLDDFQRVIVFEKGRVVEDGPPAELLSKKGALYKLREGVS